MRPVTSDDVPILVIASDDTFAHVYPSLAELLAEPGNGGKFGGAVEFFDGTGRRLAAVFDPEWHLIDLRACADPGDPVTLQRRLQAVRDHVEWYLRTYPDIVTRARLTIEQAVACLPQLGDDLHDDIFGMPDHDKGDSGNFLHNAMHAAGWSH
ncbi:hypothetical protein ACN27F_17635 [Solwaraspora sp. WMMB335]|uniref:hypothetical protein n=1 Tax=Solwaraspora sp. WMMB335 TaxID=3404118 RepID=UPI003B923C6A